MLHIICEYVIMEIQNTNSKGASYSMALLDKIKQAKDSAITSVMNTAQKMKEDNERSIRVREERLAREKQQREEQMAAELAYQNELRNKAQVKLDEIEKGITNAEIAESDSFFYGKDTKEVYRFTKDFFEKILLPANNMDKTNITMYPYVDSKLCQQINTSFDISIPPNKILMYLKDVSGNEFMLTNTMFYYRLLLENNPDCKIVGSILINKISNLTLNRDNDCYVFMCNDVEMARIATDSGKTSDYISVNKYFNDIKNADFDITNEEVDKIIKEKLNSFIVMEIENEMSDNELLQFFTYNSLGGYVACTTEKIIVASKESGGNISNTSRYYYDEIRSVETTQQAANLGPTVSTSLGGMIAETIVQSAVESAIDSYRKEVCDLEIKGDHIFKRMSNMVKIEADRIVAIFNAYKKEHRIEEKNKQALQQTPMIIQQTQSQPDILEQLEKLAKLKDAGILTEEEFAQKKAVLLDKL